MTALPVRKAAARTQSGAKARKLAVKLSKTSPGSRATEGPADVPYLTLFLQEPLRQIETIKGGFPAFAVKRIAGDLNIDQNRFLRALNLKTATLNRRAAKAENLPADESERVVGVARLVGQVEAMVKESGNPEGFNAAEWLSLWLREPLPAFGGRMPMTLLDTMAGQALVAQTLSRMQSGTYA